MLNVSTFDPNSQRCPEVSELMNEDHDSQQNHDPKCRLQKTHVLYLPVLILPTPLVLT